MGGVHGFLKRHVTTPPISRTANHTSAKTNSQLTRCGIVVTFSVLDFSPTVLGTVIVSLRTRQMLKRDEGGNRQRNDRDVQTVEVRQGGRAHFRAA